MSKKVNIMTWNVDWFRNGKRSGKPEEYFEEDSSIEVYQSIVNKIKEYVKLDNSIVFLQEVPFKAKGQGWHEHSLYGRLFKEIKSYSPCNNRIIAVSFDNYIFMGVHMPTDFRLGDNDEKMWNDLIDYVKDSIRSVIIVGDFNVYVGCDEKLTEKKYLELLKYAENCVSENIITFGTTSIDKIMVSKNKSLSNFKYTVRPELQKEFSDHKYVSMELFIES